MALSLGKRPLIALLLLFLSLPSNAGNAPVKYGYTLEKSKRRASAMVKNVTLFLPRSFKAGSPLQRHLLQSQKGRLPMVCLLDIAANALKSDKVACFEWLTADDPYTCLGKLYFFLGL